LGIRPMAPAPFGPLRVTGLRVAGQALELAVGSDGRVEVHSAPSGLRVLTGPVPLTTAARHV